MRINYGWIKKVVKDVPDYKIIADKMSMSGFVPESIEHFGDFLDNVVAGRIEKCEKHPKSEKLWVCSVNIGKDQPITVISGAPNTEANITVPIVLAGTVMPDGKKVERRELLGVLSEGMACSEKEIGLSDDHSGLMILPDDIEYGEKLSNIADMQDIVFDFEVTYNRPDCLCLEGLSRQVAASLDSEYLPYSVDLEENTDSIDKYVKVSIENEQGCPRYTVRLVKNVKVGPSPLWLRLQLLKLGQRPINNVVDAANFVLLQLGHPLHTFDYDKIHNKEIIIRNAINGEKLITLDGKERALKESDLVIADADKPVALAGVMGGENTEVSAATVNVLIESAYFDPATIHNTSVYHNLYTDASKVFERGADINITQQAADRLAALIVELASGEIAKGVIDLGTKNVADLTIKVRKNRVNSLLGIALTVEEMTNYLKRLGLQCDIISDELFAVNVPTRRRDLKKEIDIIEEIAILYGYDNIGYNSTSFPLVIKEEKHDKFLKFVRDTKTFFSAAGFFEIMTMSFMDKKISDLVDPRLINDAVQIKNPLNAEMEYLRTSLFPSLLSVAKHNLSINNSSFGLYLLNKVYRKENNGFWERYMLSGVINESIYPPHWEANSNKFDFFDIKGILEDFLYKIGFKHVNFSNADNDIIYLHPGQAAHIFIDDVNIGHLGKIHPTVAKKFDFRSANIFLFSLEIEKLFAMHVESFINVKENLFFSKFPATFKDLSVILDKDIPYVKLEKVIKHYGGELLDSVELFDIYTGQQISAEEKSLSLRLIFKSQDRTLQDKEINELLFDIINGIEKDLKGKLRK